MLSQESIEAPKQSNFYKKYVEITKVVLTDTETVLYTTFKKSEKDTLSLPKTIFVDDENSSKKKYIVKTEGFSLGEKIRFPEQGEIVGKLIFPPLEKSVSVINLNVESEPIGNWQGQPRTSRSIAYRIIVRPLLLLPKSDDAFTNISYKKAFEKAKKENKNVLLFFTAHWCGPCNNMKKFIFPKLEVNKFINENYIAVTLNSDTKKGNDLLKKYNGSAIPYFVLLTSKDELLKTQTGYSKKDVFLEFLEVNDTIKPKQLKEVVKKPTVLRKGFGLRLGMVNNRFSNNNSDSRTGFTANVFKYFTHPDDMYIFRTGLGFHSKGVGGFSVNYLKVPIEFGVKIFNGALINTAGGIRANIAPYYALALIKVNWV